MDDYREKLREYSRKLDEEIHDKGFKRDLAARFVVIWTLLSRIPLPKEWWPETVPEGNRALALAPLAGGLLGLLTGLVVSAASVLGLNALAGAWVGGEDRSIHLSSGGEGSRIALPIFANFMKKVYGDSKLGITEKDQFPIPVNAVSYDCDESAEPAAALPSGSGEGDEFFD